MCTLPAPPAPLAQRAARIVAIDSLPKKRRQRRLGRADTWSMEIEGLNPQLTDMVLRGQLSGAKIAQLLRLKEFVDSYATRNYVSDEELQSLLDRFGVEPDIITWGDYFQTEVASLHFNLNDKDFATIVDTIRFDLISAIKIFDCKPSAFFDECENEGRAAYGIPREAWTQLHEEQAHLYILSRYFRELGLRREAVSATDEDWFQGFLGQTRDATG